MPECYESQPLASPQKHPLQETKGHWNHDGFYHPLLLNQLLSKGAPAGCLHLEVV